MSALKPGHAARAVEMKAGAAHLLTTQNSSPHFQTPKCISALKVQEGGIQHDAVSTSQPVLESFNFTFTVRMGQERAKALSLHTYTQPCGEGEERPACEP